MKRFFIIIIGIIVIAGIVGGIKLINNKLKNNTETKNINSENIIDEIQLKDTEPINTTIIESDNEEPKEQDKKESVLDDNKSEVKDENKQTISDNKQTLNTTSKTTEITNNYQTKTEIKNSQTKEPEKTEPIKVEESKKEESKPVEIQKPTEPIREYKVNQNYINKLKNTITTEVKNNLEKLNKYGIKDVSQYQIIVDSSICTCYGGNRNGWTYENVSAYNTFKSSILKGTNMKIYAVDEYYNGEYIQTLCYYGH